MKNILLHYVTDDEQVAVSLSNFLRKSGYDMLINKAGTDSNPSLNSLMKMDKTHFIEVLDKMDLVIVLISQNYLKSPGYKTQSEIFERLLRRTKTPIVVIAIDDSNPQFGFGKVGYFEVDKNNILNGNFDEINTILELKKSEIYLAKMEETAEKESKKEVIKRISHSSELKKVILNLENKEKVNKRIAIGCYSIGIVVIIAGAILAYFSVSNIPSDKKSYFYIYIGAKNLAIIGVLILCSRYTFNIGKIFMDDAVKHSDRLHAIHYGNFFLDSFQEKLSFEEMKELFKDWNMDNRPLSLNNSDPTAADPNTANTNGKSEAGIAVDLLTRLTDLLASQKK